MRLRTATATLLAAGLWLTAPRPCDAATVTVHLQDGSGAPLSGFTVVLHQTSDATGAPPPQRLRYGSRAITESGLARFTSIEAGMWWVGVVSPRGSGYLLFMPPDVGPLPATRNASISAPTFTVSPSDGDLVLRVTVPRGDWVVCQLDVDQDREPGGKVYFEEIATHVRFETLLDPKGYGERLLPPGRWRVWLEPRAGELLRVFEVDHLPIAGSSATIETRGAGERIDLYWRYGAPCRVTGRVTWDVGAVPPGVVVAHLERAGSWLEDVKRIGGTSYERVPARTEPDGRYEILLLDGAWRLEPEGPQLLASDPASRTLTLRPGDEAVADFDLKAKPDEDGELSSLLHVFVVSPTGERLKDAYVAIWPLQEGAEKHDPLKRARTVGATWPSAAFRGLPAGSYLVVAGHREHREGREVVERFDAVPRRPRAVSVVLGAGAELTAIARDEDDAPARAIALTVDLEGDGEPSVLDDPDLRRERAHRRAVTDETGRTRIGGLDAGSYRLEAALTEHRQGTHFVRIEKSDPAGSVSHATLAENEKKEVVIRLDPAASVTARLACADRGPLPPKASVLVLPPDAMWAATDRRTDTPAVLALENVVLTGREHDALFAGPVPAGTYTIAVRPEGFDRWTLAPGTEDPERAVPAPLEAGRPRDLGIVDLDCGPTVRVHAEIGTGEAAPDLRDAVLSILVRRVPGREEPHSDSPGSRQAAPLPTLPEPRQESREAFLRLRGLPEGPIVLEGGLGHPDFVPAAIRIDAATHLLERGREATVRVVVPHLGGAIRFDSTLGGAPGTAPSLARRSRIPFSARRERSRRGDPAGALRRHAVRGPRGHATARLLDRRDRRARAHGGPSLFASTHGDADACTEDERRPCARAGPPSLTPGRAGRPRATPARNASLARPSEGRRRGSPRSPSSGNPRSPVAPRPRTCAGRASRGASSASERATADVSVARGPGTSSSSVTRTGRRLA